MNPEVMSENKSIFIDTAPFIYLIENNTKYSTKVEELLADYISLNYNICSSVISYMEFCVIPDRDGRLDVIESFNNLLLKLNISIFEINIDVAIRGYKLRSSNPSLKGMDALQLACALENDCSEFITNDEKLKKINEINVTILH